VNLHRIGITLVIREQLSMIVSRNFIAAAVQLWYALQETQHALGMSWSPSVPRHGLFSDRGPAVEHLVLQMQIRIPVPVYVL